MQEILVRLQYSVENGGKADGGQVDHEEWQKLSTQLDLVRIKVAEKCNQVVSMEIGYQHQWDKQQALERTQ